VNRKEALRVGRGFEPPHLALSLPRWLVGNLGPAVFGSSGAVSKGRHDRLKFRVMWGFCDYYPERPGGLREGRGLETPIFSGRKFGKLFDQLRPHPIKTVFDLVFTVAEIRKISLARANPRYWVDALKILTRNLGAKTLRLRHFGTGAALIARLRLSLHEQGVPLWLNAPVKEIVFGDDSVIGVEVEKEGKRVRIGARKGVVLAAGGFPQSEAMRKRHHRPPVSTEWTAAAPGNSGDAIEMGMAAGAAVDLMDDIWGMPTVLRSGEHPFPLVLERSYPHSIMVNSAGRRFTNEAGPYVDVVHAMIEANEQGARSIPSFLIMDACYRNRYVLTTLPPGWTPKESVGEEGFLQKADTLGELARKTGVDPAGLMETIRRFNAYVREGRDPEFGRGDSAYDRFYSDPTVKPNCCLGTIAKPPFYSMQIWPGDIGTKGGLVTNENAQVLTVDGEIIEGLYAVGNTAASVMGRTYPGPGGTIGPAMTFAYIAAMHAAGCLENG
jgi:3-oxosteroid 1-dehydrogenase